MSSQNRGGDLLTQQNTTLFERIQSCLNTMSDAKRAVARYLLEHWEEAAFLSASRLARKVGVSESVVVRFAQDLDYSGFPALQSALQHLLRNRLTGVIPSATEDREITGEPGPATEPAQRVADLTFQNLRATLHTNQPATFGRAVELILGANRIAVVAGRNALGPATVLSVHLNEVLTNTNLLGSDRGDLFDFLRPLTKDDLLITIAIPDYSRRTVQASEFAAERGVPQIAITDSIQSPLARSAAVTLITHNRSLAYGGSHVATVFLVDVLVHLITLGAKGPVLKALEELHTVNRRFGLVDQD